VVYLIVSIALTLNYSEKYKKNKILNKKLANDVYVLYNIA